MPLLGRPGALFRRGNSLVSPPVGFPGCVCCPRYDCLPGGFGCQECKYDRNGPYRTLLECEPECPEELCAWCVEFDNTDRCGDPYQTYACVTGPCDEDGACLPPGLPIVAGPIKITDPSLLDCEGDLCPPAPPLPPEPECCGDEDCGCCESCIDGECVGCPPGTVCVNCVCMPPEDPYYCCQEPYEYGQPPPDTYCQRGPCAPPATQVGGPYEDYTDCCASCGCNYECRVPGYECYPDPAGPYETPGECEESCQPPGSLGACCYTIAPYSEDNDTLLPVEGCALVRGCFGVITFSECEALKTATGTNTTWYPDYDTCDLCPVTEESVCCYDDPDSPCADTLCLELDESCCDAINGTRYLAVEDCESLWPSGLSACRDDQACNWPAPDSEQYFEQVFKERGYEYTPQPPRPLNSDPPCILAPQWNAGYPAKLDADCLGKWRWVRQYSRCNQAGVDGVRYGKDCVRYRLMAKKGSRILDITDAAVSNSADLDCCACSRANNWAGCQGNECEPLQLLELPEAICLP